MQLTCPAAARQPWPRVHWQHASRCSHHEVLEDDLLALPDWILDHLPRFLRSALAALLVPAINGRSPEIDWTSPEMTPRLEFKRPWRKTAGCCQNQRTTSFQHDPASEHQS